jgi:hypothetical protein
MPTIRILGPEDAAVIDRVAEGIFDNTVDQRWAGEFLADSRHHPAVANDVGQVVGMASAVITSTQTSRPSRSSWSSSS